MAEIDRMIRIPTSKNGTVVGDLAEPRAPLSQAPLPCIVRSRRKVS